MLDLKIADAQMLDGTGAPPVRADVGVTGESIDASGIEHVIVSGSVVVRGGEQTGNLPGRVLGPAAG